MANSSLNTNHSRTDEVQAEKLETHRHFCFVLIPGYSLLAVAGAIDVLRAANLGMEDTASTTASKYSWQLIGTDVAVHEAARW